VIRRNGAEPAGVTFHFAVCHLVLGLGNGRKGDGNGKWQGTQEVYGVLFNNLDLNPNTHPRLHPPYVHYVYRLALLQIIP